MNKSFVVQGKTACGFQRLGKLHWCLRCRSVAARRDVRAHCRLSLRMPSQCICMHVVPRGFAAIFVWYVMQTAAADALELFFTSLDIIYDGKFIQADDVRPDDAFRPTLTQLVMHASCNLVCARRTPSDPSAHASTRLGQVACALAGLRFCMFDAFPPRRVCHLQFSPTWLLIDAVVVLAYGAARADTLQDCMPSLPLKAWDVIDFQVATVRGCVWRGRRMQISRSFCSASMTLCV
jgi:hypothetical protein